jgi:hypothetical protein
MVLISVELQCGDFVEVEAPFDVDDIQAALDGDDDVHSEILTWLNEESDVVDEFTGEAVEFELASGEDDEEDEEDEEEYDDDDDDDEFED